MATEETEPCNNCGKDFPGNHERCTKCGMYRVEDPQEFNKYNESTKMFGLIKRTLPQNPIKTAKGEYDGDCNRTACDKKQAKWYNHSTRAYYCGKCAMQINTLNPEFLRDNGYMLCVHHPEINHT